MSLKTSIIRIVLVLGIVSPAVYYSYTLIKEDQKLPIINPHQLNPELVEEDLQEKRKYHVIGDFDLTDQKGEKVTPKTFENKIYVASFFFTTCPGICVSMRKNMQSLIPQLDEKVMFLSHSVTPVSDTPEVLNEYAQNHGIEYNKWRLVTGDKKQIYNLARRAYFAAKIDNSDFIHTENFVLIDTKKRIRGFYDGTNPKEVEQLGEDIKILKREIFE